MTNSIDQYSNFMFYTSDDGSVNVRVLIDEQNETIWLNQKGIAELFGKSASTINEHIRKIYQEGELSEENTMRKFGISEFSTKPTNFYNLDVIIAVGYRVNSYQATQFRIWATKILKEYLIKGFALDDERLKQGNRLFGKDHFKELIERIQEIRASERMFYEKITDIFRDCSIDYDPKSPVSQDFYAKMQNKFHYAIHQHTASEIIKERADSTKPFMGLTNWKRQKVGGKIYKSDILIAKNYLQETEIKSLNRLVNMFLDYAERMAEKGKGSFTMQDWAKRLEMFLNFNEYPVLTDSGKVKADIAKRFAETEYEKFRVIQDREYKSDFNRFLEIHSIEDVPSEQVNTKIGSEAARFNMSLKTALNYNPHKEGKKKFDGEDES